MQDNLARKLPQEQRVVKQKPKKKKKQKFRWGLAVFSIFIFSLSMVLVMRYAKVAELEREILLAKAQYEQLESSNIARKVKLKQNIDIENVEKIATEKLGMVKPSKSQIIHIKVPVEDETRYNEAARKRYLTQDIAEGIGKIVAYLH